ncbi:hypothetical protein ANTPLA_LOCUS10503 [Anthophora plagiata]
MPWSGEHRGFVVEAFFKNGESVIATQREFRTRFGLRANENVPDRKTILLWVRRVRATGSALKRKPPGRPKNVRTSENIAAVRASIEQSPARSARKHAKALGISERTVRRILHTDLHLHPYKIMVCLDYGVWIAVKRSSQLCLPLAFCGVAMKLISTFLGLLISKIFATGLLKTLGNSMHYLFTAQK